MCRQVFGFGWVSVSATFGRQAAERIRTPTFQVWCSPSRASRLEHTTLSSSSYTSLSITRASHAHKPGIIQVLVLNVDVGSASGLVGKQGGEWDSIVERQDLI